LDADGEHEQGAIFTQALLRLVAGKQIPQLMNAAAREDYVVELERHERTDVSVYQRRAFAIFIENKVRASERTEQVEDMIKTLVRLAISQQIPKAYRFAVFLTDDGRAPTSKSSGDIQGFDLHNLKPLSRVAVFDAFHEALNKQRTSRLLVNLLSCYRSAVDQLRRL
jgi:hypothetical protein